jgi:hypothetical protein
MLSPALLFFIFGILIGILKTDLKIPDSISKFLSLYLIVSIGFKGGSALAAIGTLNWQEIALFVTAIMFSLGIPFIAYFILQKTTGLDRFNAAAIAAHYGSVSVVTFITAGAFLAIQGLTYSGYLVAVLALMEAPAILSGIYLAHYVKESGKSYKDLFFKALASSGCLVLLLCSFLIGWLAGEAGYLKVKNFFEAPFQGILCFFLLDMGLTVAAQLEYLKKFTWNLFFFGLYMPLIGAMLGLIICYVLGLDVGTSTMFMVLCASASYIAVPASVRMAIPEAKAALYLPMALAITFPFNIIVGVPLYYTLATFFLI